MYAVIGDIHGCIKTLDTLVNRTENSSKIDKYIFLGDLIDRGNGIKEVIEFIAELKKNKDVTVIKGNHEDMLLDYLRGRLKYFDMWLGKAGGKETIKSFTGGNFFLELAMGKYIGGKLEKYFEPYMDFFNSMQNYDSLICENENFLFTHAGMKNPDPSRGIIKSFPASYGENIYFWPRDTHLRQSNHCGYVPVYGHTPVASLEIDGADPDYPYLNFNRKGELCSICIDTGCVYGNSLSAMLINYTGEFEFKVERFRD